jgi:lipoprotein-releasing system permease protein
MHVGPMGGGRAFEWRLALRYLTTRRREGPVAFVTLLCTVGVAMGAFALVLGLALTRGLQGDIRTRLLASHPHVLVQPAFREPAYDIPAGEEVARRVREVDGVAAAAPFAHEVGLLRSELTPQGQHVELFGVDPAGADRVTGLASLATQLGWTRLFEDERKAGAVPSPAADADEGEPPTLHDLAPPSPPALLLGEGLAQRLGVLPGDRVHMLSMSFEMSPTGVPLPRSRAFEVAGLLHSGFPDQDDTWAVAGLKRLSAGRAIPIEGVQVAVSDPGRAPEIARRIQEHLGPAHLVTDWTQTFARLFAAFRWEKLLMVLAVGLIGLVAGFNILTILTLNVTARVADIGILSALGASAASITRIFRWMGLLLGALGTAAGLLAGIACALLLDHFQVIQLDPQVYFASYVPFRVVASDVAMVAAAMLVVSYLTTLPPARAAASLDPVVALRNA